MEKETILVVLLVGLVVLSGAQALQINDLKEEVQTGSLVAVAPSISSPTQQVRAVQQPSMVGGC